MRMLCPLLAVRREAAGRLGRTGRAPASVGHASIGTTVYNRGNKRLKAR